MADRKHTLSESRRWQRCQVASVTLALALTLATPAQPPAPTTPVPLPAPGQPAQLVAPPVGPGVILPPQAADGPPPPPTVEARPKPVPLPAPARRFQFPIDPKTPLKDLLPRPPKVGVRKPVLLGDDLAQTPEIAFQEPLEAGEKAFEEVARQIAKINHVNKKATDHFMTVLLAERADLRGLPFLMGDACRTQGERTQQFTLAVQLVREATRTPESQIPVPAVLVEHLESQVWVHFRTCCDRADSEGGAAARQDQTAPARVAAVMQVFGPAPTKVRLGMVKHLAGVSHPEATRALARLALFSTEEDVRRAAVAALQTRRERDYTQMLMDGFRYPWSAVSRRAADAVVRLDRKDLLARLVDVLDQPDPRAPMTKQLKGKAVPVVRELVRINHHRNCLLCHAPGNTDKVSPDATLAAVPIPGQPLSPPSEGYNGSTPEVQVRIDVTYLRQDFSVLQPVADARPWPEMQRFDFLVRTREIGDEEASEYQRLLKREPGVLPTNHRAALHALRELTGNDAAPTAIAWRELLGLSAKQ